MDQFRFGTMLLLAAMVLIGGWAFIELSKPENLLEWVRLFAWC